MKTKRKLRLGGSAPIPAACINVLALQSEIAEREQAIAATERYVRALIRRGQDRAALLRLERQSRDRQEPSNALATSEEECADARAALLELELVPMRAYVEALQQALDQAQAQGVVGIGKGEGSTPPAASDPL